MAISGKILGAGIVLSAALFGAGVYYAQVYGYYSEIPPTQGRVTLTPQNGNGTQDIPFSDFRGIDAQSSPIRYRACFSTPLSLAQISDRFTHADKAVPLNAPRWFSCFDAAQIGADLEQSVAQAFIGQRNFEYGVDRIVAIYPDGRGYVWHQLNECGNKLYDGSPASADCPQKER